MKVKLIVDPLYGGCPLICFYWPHLLGVMLLCQSLPLKSMVILLVHLLWIDLTEVMWCHFGDQDTKRIWIPSCELWNILLYHQLACHEDIQGPYEEVGNWMIQSKWRLKVTTILDNSFRVSSCETLSKRPKINYNQFLDTQNCKIINLQYLGNSTFWGNWLHGTK